jgi:hypothetical protein
MNNVTERGQVYLLEHMANREVGLDFNFNLGNMKLLKENVYLPVANK